MDEALGALFVTVVLTLLVSQGGLSKSYDWDLYLPWLDEFSRQLINGEWGPQWMPSAFGGRGAPVFAYYPPLSLYAGALVVAMVGKPVFAMKALVVMAGLLSYLSFLFWGRDAGTRRTVAWAVIWALSPAALFIGLRVHMLAAVFALPAIPLLAKAVLSSSLHGTSRLLLTAVATAWLGWCHLPTLLMAGITGGIWAAVGMVVTQGDRSRFAWMLGGVFLGLLASASTLVGPLFEADELHLPALSAGALLWSENFLFNHQAWDVGFRVDYRFLSLVVACFGLAGAGAALAIWRSGACAWALLCSVVVLGALMTPLAQPMYAGMTALQYLQFPWRWLPLFVFGCCALGALAPPRFQRTALVTLAIAELLSLALLVFGHSALLPPRPRTTPEDERWVLSQVPRSAPEYRRYPRAPAAERPTPRPRELRADVAHFVWRSDHDEAARAAWTTRSSGHAHVRTDLSCYGGWQAALDGENLPLSCSPDGFVAFELPAGEHTVALDIQRTTARQVAVALSLSAVCVAVLMWLATLVQLRRNGVGGEPG